jgi:hypothetical protein
MSMCGYFVAKLLISHENELRKIIFLYYNLIECIQNLISMAILIEQEKGTGTESRHIQLTVLTSYGTLLHIF